MQFKFSWTDDRPLRPIPLIPDQPACLIEGRNGAGKSLAVRLLQLATGEQPYAATPAAWRSLRDGLSETKITATGMSGATSIEWTLRPSQWPPDPAPIGEWLGEFRVDGQLADIVQVRDLLRVHRVAGDETLGETIAREIREDLVLVQRERQSVDVRADRLDQYLLDLSDRVSGVRVAELTELAEEQRNIRRRLRDLREAIPGLRSRFLALDSARAARATLTQLEADGPELRRQIDEESKVAADAAATINDLEQRRVEIAGLAANEAELRASLNASEAELGKRLQAAEKAQLGAVRRATQLGLGPESEKVRRAHQAAVADRDAIVRRLAQFDVGPRLDSLAHSLDARLREAVSAGLSDSLIAHLDDGRDLTVGELEKGITSQTERKQQPADVLVAELRARASDADTRVSSLWSLRQSVAYAERKVRDVGDQAAVLERIREQLAPDAAKRYSELSGEIDSERTRHLQAVVRRADLTAQLDRLSGGRVLTDIQRDLDADLAEAGVDGSELDQAWALANIAYETSREELETLTSNEQVVGASLKAKLAAVRDVATSLATPELSWLTSTTGLSPATPAADLSTARQLERLGQVIDRARDLLQGSVARLVALESPLEAMSGAIGRNDAASLREAPPKLQALYDGLLGLYEEEFTGRFRAKEITDALFDGAESVSLDLRSLSVSWTMADGTARTRPLEAFSSGERAFAYTLARLESLASQPTRNRVIALDEFGAFVARDRLDRLVRFLRNRILGTIAQQVLIILPLTQDYAGQVESTTGDWHELVVRRAQAVEEQGYFAEPFDAPA